MVSNFEVEVSSALLSGMEEFLAALEALSAAMVVALAGANANKDWTLAFLLPWQEGSLVMTKRG